MNLFCRWFIYRNTRHWDRCAECNAHQLYSHRPSCSVGQKEMVRMAEPQQRCRECWVESGQQHTLSCSRTSVEDFFDELGIPRDCGFCGAGFLDEHHPECDVSQNIRAEADRQPLMERC